VCFIWLLMWVELQSYVLCVFGGTSAWERGGEVDDELETLLRFRQGRGRDWLVEPLIVVFYHLL